MISRRNLGMGLLEMMAMSRGYKALYRRTVTQAPDGCDFDFLTQAEG